MLPQLIIIMLWMLGLGIMMSKHGRPKKGNENAWAHLISIVITAAILCWGGFFDVFFKG